MEIRKDYFLPMILIRQDPKVIFGSTEHNGGTAELKGIRIDLGGNEEIVAVMQ